ncbi:MAG: LysR family transcriptional regulator [Sphingomonadaceae bacterium]
MEMHQVRYFLAVARERNFTRAAEACNVTQPSLTRAIQKLEEEFGGLLFRRERALTHLTELGRLMLPHLERSYAAAQAARALARQVERGQVSPLAVGLAADVHLDGLPLLFHDLSAAFPGFSLSLTVRDAEALVAEAMAGDLDAIIGAFGEGLPDRIDRWELREERLGQLVPAGEPDPGLPRIVVGSAEAEGPVHRAGSLAAAAFLVAGRLGTAIVPEGLPRPEGTRWKRIEGIEGVRQVELLAVAGRHRPPAVDAFLKSVRARGWQLEEAG